MVNEPGKNTESTKRKEVIADDLFTMVFHASPDSITVSRMSDGVFIDVNEGFERISGYSRDEVIGRSSLGFAFWADGPQRRDAFIHELKTKGSVRDFSARWLTRTNEIRDCLAAGEMIEYQGEQCLVLVITDITTRLRAQRELERSEKLYRSIVAGQTDFIVRWLPGGIRTFVNDAYCEYFGVSQDECIGTSFFSLVDEEWREGIQRKINSLTPGNPVARSQHRVVRRDGTEGWNEWVDRAVFDDQGHVIEYQSVGRDITPSKRTQQALQQSESLLRKVADNSPNSIALKDRDGYYIMVNRAMAERNGTTPAEMVGKRDTEFAANWQMTPAALEEYFARDQKVIDSNETVVLLAEEYTYRDGSTRWYQTTKVPIALSGGKRGLLSVSVDVTEFKRAEEERRQAEEQYRRTFECVTNGLTVRDTDGKIVAVNPAMCELYGYTEEEYCKLTLADLMPPDVYPMLDEIRRTVAADKTFATEAKGVHKSGRLMDLEIRVTPFQYRGQKHTLTIAWDITERKRAEEALRLTQTAIDAASDMILRVRNDGRIDYANDEACHATEYSREELLSMTVFDVDPEYHRLAFNTVWDKLRDSDSFLLEREWTTKSGRKIPTEVRIHRVEFSGQEYVFAFARNIAERKRAAAALNASEVRYRTLFQSASDAIFLMDGDRFVDCNPATLAMYRCTKDQIVGRAPFDELVSPPLQPDGSPSKAKARALLRATAVGAVQRFEWRHRRFDGTLFDAEVALTKMDAGETSLIIAEVRDISERKRAEDQLVKLNEQLLAEREALDQKNIALGEVLSHMEQNREKYKHEICESVEKLILPTVTKLGQKGGHIGPNEAARLKNALEAIIEKDLDVFASNWNRLSARELDICELIRAGSTSKEMARKLNISLQTVHTHRHAIRRKLQIKNKGVNLAAYLRSRPS